MFTAIFMPSTVVILVLGSRLSDVRLLSIIRYRD
jgi:hypothetical protein